MSSGPVEIEIKLRVANAAAGRDLLTAAGFRVSSERSFEANSVYDTPGQELRGRGHLLRLRQAGTRTLLTWKGSTVAARHKHRPELEVFVGDYSVFDQILSRLGYQPVFRYEKFRTEFRHPAADGVATLDETPIGTFIELEGSPEWIDATAARLHFCESEYITASYGSLYLDYCRERNLPPDGMTFPPNPRLQ